MLTPESGPNVTAQYERFISLEKCMLTPDEAQALLALIDEVRKPPAQRRKRYTVEETSHLSSALAILAACLREGVTT
jgi:predicted DNA-binding transcriptional regulator YafY